MFFLIISKGVYSSTAYGLCFIDQAIKCVNGDAYKDFVNIEGCEDWLDNEKAAFEKQKANMESVVNSSSPDETRKKNAKKELEKLKLALDKMEEFGVQCQNNGNFHT